VEVDPYRFPINPLDYPADSEGEVVTKDGEILGRWTLSGGATPELVAFTTDGAEEVLLQGHDIGVRCSDIGEWRTETRRSWALWLRPIPELGDVFKRRAATSPDRTFAAGASSRHVYLKVCLRNTPLNLSTLMPALTKVAFILRGFRARWCYEAHLAYSDRVHMPVGGGFSMDQRRPLDARVIEERRGCSRDP